MVSFMFFAGVVLTVYLKRPSSVGRVLLHTCWRGPVARRPGMFCTKSAALKFTRLPPRTSEMSQVAVGFLLYGTYTLCKRIATFAQGVTRVKHGARTSIREERVVTPAHATASQMNQMTAAASLSSNVARISARSRRRLAVPRSCCVRRTYGSCYRSTNSKGRRSPQSHPPRQSHSRPHNSSRQRCQQPRYRPRSVRRCPPRTPRDRRSITPRLPAAQAHLPLRSATRPSRAPPCPPRNRQRRSRMDGGCPHRRGLRVPRRSSRRMHAA